MAKQILASIELDDYPPRRTPRRGNIKLIKGRLWCDGNDITPCPETMTREEAVDAVEQMYGIGPFRLEWNESFLEELLSRHDAR